MQRRLPNFQDNQLLLTQDIVFYIHGRQTHINIALFSERPGYNKPRDTFIRENITIPIQNAICSAFDTLKMQFDRIDVNQYGNSGTTYSCMELGFFSQPLKSYMYIPMLVLPELDML